MARQPASPVIIVIHRRQIIVYQRIRMNHLYRRRRYLGVAINPPAYHFAAPQHYRRPDALARPRQSIMNRHPKLFAD
jgi:hypothetical protein